MSCLFASGGQGIEGHFIREVQIQSEGSPRYALMLINASTTKQSVDIFT